VERAARELADALQTDGRLGSRTVGPVDHFADPTPFEELLRG
jgi:hypothetical protein